MAEKQIPLLEMRGITKFFPGVKALDKVDIDLHCGEVLAIIGENGAGKSTLMKVLGGVHLQDAGKIFIEGREEIIDSVGKSTELGIAFVHQELNLSDNLDIAGNVFLGREPQKKNLLKLVDRSKLYEDTQKLLNRLHLNCSPKTTVRNLAIGTQQLIEIAKALSIQAKIIIMDEPTSSLSRGETEHLFKVIRELRSKGVSIIYISHRLAEVMEIADRVTVLRDGCVSGNLERTAISQEKMIQLIVGRDIDKFYSHDHKEIDQPVFEVRNLRIPSQPDHLINFTIHAGEILVLAGLVGAGRTDLVHTLFGIDQPLEGAIMLDGERLEISNPWDAIEAGIALVPEDRKLHGLIVEMAVEQNITLAGLHRYQKLRIIQSDETRSIANDMVKKLNIRLTSIDQIAASLSGGNQQKIVLAKWLSLNPRVLLLDEPTRGIDVAAKEEIYHLMERLSSQGLATLVISSEMQEVLGIADRIIVMSEGKISGELHKGEFSEEAVVRLATQGG